ncbi:MAG: type II toxin-antitoxin system RnlB family antitoxin [Nitrospirae bacterium]|uniref:type II toxin-antitoxin system RnlB family antitoxin n=1 Tax=Candidatus Magnetobacterium casense TaxID=1455061 RepID=UPI00058DE7C6|nr:type II toxin-antitoxin system RnlB family antitoxin [Candidatus Magnetobacterium casensis]MBF0337918.1 type II toxin-antitoxin system RnlB family antitoxin [Nitrospirota bacterium]
MKKQIYNKCCSSFFYIDVIKDKILVISIGSDSPFDFLHVLTKTIIDKSQTIKMNVIEVYFDLLSCVGNRINRFAKTTYDKKGKAIDFLSTETIERETLPADIISTLQEFYGKHLEEATKYSILTSSEKEKLILAPI